MGEEFWAKGTNIQEGPGVNVARVQKNGRNFEYMSGEDPALGAALLRDREPVGDRRAPRSGDGARVVGDGVQQRLE